MQTTVSTASTAARDPPGIEEVRSQLERIVASAEFPGLGRSAAFLRYVVEEAIAGRAARIKGYPSQLRYSAAMKASRRTIRSCGSRPRV